MFRIAILISAVIFISCGAEKKPVINNVSESQNYNEPHRPQIHFSPVAHWMNDPNGMVFYNNNYHLFFQYYPDSTVWGPMHWGHAVSKDMIHWKELPIALYPDSLGYIFSGSAVADVNNTSGFAENGKTPLVAIFTYHDPKGEKAGTSTYQNQGLAFSLDEGKSWTKYDGNPVLKNPGIKDFRDPKVSWYEAGKKWIMTLATLDRITFYSSPDLKNWTKESEFGKEIGAHGGVWECPDLFALDYNGKTVWVLIVNINPGGPNGGSATQYFTGEFNGSKFTPYQTDTRWLDYGPDEYAGVTWSNTGNRKIFLGWMSNWQYANVVPTEKWRSATTVPRELGIEKVGDEYLLTSLPVMELNNLDTTSITRENIRADHYSITEKKEKLTGPFKIEITSDTIASFSIAISNSLGENIVAGYDKASNHYFIDRTKSGKVDFEKGFAARHTAQRFSDHQNLNLTLIVDDASIEWFADKGLTTMTEIFFPHETFSMVEIESTSNLKVKTLKVTRLKSIWR